MYTHIHICIRIYIYVYIYICTSCVEIGVYIYIYIRSPATCLGSRLLSMIFHIAASGSSLPALPQFISKICFRNQRFTGVYDGFWMSKVDIYRHINTYYIFIVHGVYHSRFRCLPPKNIAVDLMTRNFCRCLLSADFFLGRRSPSALIRRTNLMRTP